MNDNSSRMIHLIGKYKEKISNIILPIFFTSDIADRMGVPYLQRTLSIQLTEHILKCLPDLKRDLQARHRDLTKDVAEYQATAMFESSSSSDTKALVG